MICIQAYRASIGSYHLSGTGPKSTLLHNHRHLRRTTYNRSDLLFLEKFWQAIETLIFIQLLISDYQTSKLLNTTKNKLSDIRLRPKPTALFLSLLYVYLLILIHGDIESNPGPQPQQFTCMNSLDTYLLNARSMKSIDTHRNKLLEFKELIHLTRPAIMAVTETWLNKKVKDTQIATSSEYNVYRKDRILKKGGGVLLLVDAKIRSQRKDKLELTTHKHNEILVVELEPTLGTKYLVIVAYRSQKDPVPNFVQNLDQTLTNCLKANYTDYLLLGDFNMNKLKWQPALDKNLPTHSQSFLNLIHSYGLTQLNRNPSTTKGNILDLVLTNFPDKLSKIYASTYHYRSDHFLLDFKINITTDKIIPPPRQVYDFKNANYQNLKTELQNHNLLTQLNDLATADSKWDYWKMTILGAINNNIRKITIKHNDTPPWMTKPLLQLIRRKNIALKRAKSLDSPDTWQKFKRVRNRVKNMIGYKQRSYLFTLCNTLRENPKAFWTLLKSQSKSNSTPTKMFFNGKEANTPGDIATLLNSFFHSIFTPIPKVIQYPNILTHADPNLAIIQLTIPEVTISLKKLNPGKAQGPDNIPTKILKDMADILAPSITGMFNFSLSHGTIPNAWKMANIIPIHKKGSRHQATNYRPISLLPVISKVLERCIYNKIIEHIIPKLSNQQHGFLSSRSTTTQLLTVFSRINNILDNGNQADVIYFDLSKAFDSVPHKLLIHKLRGFGINGSLLNWISDYLTNRLQRVLINGTESAWLPVTSGVPQGSILGPLLFLLYINDLPNALSPDTLCAIFADDTKIYRQISNPNDALALQNDIDSLHKWSMTWGLTFNSTKCMALSIKRRNHPYRHPYKMDSTPLPRITDMNDLGVNINSKLRWNNHITNITKKANQRLWLIKRTIGYRAPVMAKTTTYITMVRSLLEYGTPVWNPSTKDNLTQLETIQRKATNYILNNPPYYALGHIPYKQRLIACNLLPTSYRREFYDLIFFIKCIKGWMHFSILDYTAFIINRHNRPTRNTNHGLNLTTIQTRLEATSHFYTHRITRTWNSLPLDLRQKLLDSPTISNAKRHLKDFYDSRLLNHFDHANTCTWILSCRCPQCRT